MLDILKAILPGSFPFLVLGSATGVALLYGPGRARLFGRRWLTFLVALFMALSVPLTVDWIAWPLNRPLPGVPASNTIDTETVIVLLAGRCDSVMVGPQRIEVPWEVTLLRILEALRWHRMAGGLVVVSGASGTDHAETETIKAELMRNGVPADRILLDSQSRNTHQSALNLARLLKGRRLILVTSSMHMRRSLASFRAAGLHPSPAPAPDGFDVKDGRVATLVSPSLRTLGIGQSAVYEYLALAYYWSRGWI